MAEYCPKCNYKLRLRDWRPECPNCGVNMMYYGIEDRLREEADAAELQHAKIQPKFDRLKFSMIGHPLSIVRLVLGLLPIAATLLPMGTLHYILPFSETDKTVNLISVINYISEYGLDFNLLSELAGTELLGKGTVTFAVALISFLFMLVATLVGFILLTLSAAPKGILRNIIMSSIGIVSATAAQVSFAVMVKSLSAELPGIFTGTVNPAAYIVVVLLFVAMITVNVIYKKKDIKVKYKDVSEFLLPYNERPSTKAKLAAGTQEENAPAEEIKEQV